ncbi:MAG: hypothetical protein JWQ81_6192 [Amycolatopsis sp.]|jgi:hypothetical protein|uniref:DUF3558 domain-containing protein n=1 Tax=Amycolatopsis sp. TaxID=37632 RepID=UPI00260B8930|nr:DUF3558 domain-containing protein [Amycolatopsis sp.]MCU1685453.1 hypothetical protein [Amycolatopsis sp.]
MVRRYGLTATALVVGAVLLSACSNSTVTGVANTPSAAPSDPSSSSNAAVPHSGAPKVQNPLPAKVLGGSPCDTAFTAAQLTHFLGPTTPPKATTDQLGTACLWQNEAGNGSGLSVGYQTKVHDGISLAYQTVEPTASRWVVLDSVQGYPAIGYVSQHVDPSAKDNCVIVVGISDELAYSISLGLSDGAIAQHKDACLSGRDVADAMMTNMKARA